MTPFGLFLQEISRDRNLAQKQLAGLLDVDQSYLSGLESGRKGAPPASMTLFDKCNVESVQNQLGTDSPLRGYSHQPPINAGKGRD